MNKNILLAVVGKSPVIIFEAIHALDKQQQIQLDEIHCITTGDCRTELIGTIYDCSEDALVKKFCAKNGIKYKETCFWATGENDSIDHSRPHLTIIKDENGNNVNDILSYQDNEAALRTCLEKVYELKKDNTTVSGKTVIYYLIAGGRKTMAGNLTLAAQWYAEEQDRICHVLLDPSDSLDKFSAQTLCLESFEEILKRNNVFLHLIRFPVLSIRKIFANEEQFKKPDIGCLMESLVRDDKEDFLRLDKRTRTIRFKSKAIEFSSASGNGLGLVEFVQYYFFAKHSRKFFINDSGNSGESLTNAGNKNEMLDIYRAYKNDNARLFSLEESTIRARISKINKAIEKIMGEADCPIKITTTRNTHGTAYGLDFPGGKIDLGATQQSSPSEKIILLAVTGQSPQVVTEALYSLALDDQTVDEVHCITTGEGKRQLEENNFFDAANSPISMLCKEYEHLFSQTVSFTEEMVYLPSDSNNTIVADILSPENNRLLLELCLQKADEFTKTEDTRVFFLIAGGRKTMSSCLTMAAQIYGRNQDRIYHVLVSPPPVERAVNFWYPTRRFTSLKDQDDTPVGRSDKVKIDLVNLPFPMGGGKYLQDTRPDPEKLVKHLTEESDFYINVYITKNDLKEQIPEIKFQVVFRRKNEKQPKEEVILGFNDKHSVLYAYMLYIRKKNINNGVVNITWHQEAYTCPEEMVEGVNEIYSMLGPTDSDIDLASYFSEYRTLINNTISSSFCYTPPQYYLQIQSRKNTTPNANGTDYFILIDLININFFPSSFKVNALGSQENV